MARSLVRSRAPVRRRRDALARRSHISHARLAQCDVRTHSLTMLKDHTATVQALLGTLFTWALTAAGAALVIVIRGKQVSTVTVCSSRVWLLPTDIVAVVTAAAAVGDESPLVTLFQRVSALCACTSSARFVTNLTSFARRVRYLSGSALETRVLRWTCSFTCTCYTFLQKFVLAFLVSGRKLCLQ